MIQTPAPALASTVASGRRLAVGAAARAMFAACLLLTAAAAFLPWRLTWLRAIPWREAEHSCAFFVLTCGAALSFPRIGLGRIVAGAVALGAGMELVQATAWVGRHGALSDWLADALGAAVVLLVSSLISLRARQTQPARAPAPRRGAPERRFAPERRVRLARAERIPGR